jgi:Mg-chelatase subunit ChlI
VSIALEAGGAFDVVPGVVAMGAESELCVQHETTALGMESGRLRAAQEKVAGISPVRIDARAARASAVLRTRLDVDLHRQIDRVAEIAQNARRLRGAGRAV